MPIDTDCGGVLTRTPGVEAHVPSDTLAWRIEEKGEERAENRERKGGKESKKNEPGGNTDDIDRVMARRYPMGVY